MKRLLFAGGVVLALAAPPAHAQAVVTCTNCSTIGQQLIDYGKQIQQLANEIQTATNTLNTYTTLVQNTISLPRSLYADITNTVNQLEALRNQASLLTGNSGLILGNLSSGTFPVVNMQTGIDDRNERPLQCDAKGWAAAKQSAIYTEPAVVAADHLRRTG